MSAKLYPSSDASRPKSAGILTPDSDASSHRNSSRSHDGWSAASSRRRKMAPQALPMEELLKPTVAVKPHPPNLLVKPRLLLPLMLLPREHLPLSCLDLSSPHGDLPPGRLFESHIRILELEGRLGSNLLIARSEAGRSVYAVERHDNGLFVLCKLGVWVDLVKLSQLATVHCQERIHPDSRPGTAAAEPALTTPQLHKENKRKRLAIEELQSMVRKRARSQSVSVQEQQQPCATQPSLPQDSQQESFEAQPLGPPPSDTQQSVGEPLADPKPQVQVAGEPANDSISADQPTAEAIFQNIRVHYFEALYRSMGSLAYFAKGPLSRARAAFHYDYDGNLDMNDLIEFLKSLVMTTIVVDKKYRETIPEIMSNMKTLVESSEDGESKPKKKKPKKMRIGKNGLYPTEEGHIKKWWNTHNPETGDDESTPNPNETRYHVSYLRTRETQLQMIIIFEILALEALKSPENATESQLPGLETSTPPKELPKKRSKHNLPVLMDLHADRLCIWRSTTLDEVRAIAESQMPETQKSDKHSDPLKDFCVDIILPFFSARLPELSDSINRKLGGPVVVSPPKPKASRSSASSKSQPKPGAATKRPVPKPPRTLERVLSNDKFRRSISRGPTDAIAQMRSATVAAVPGLKRESSDQLSLGNVPKDSMGSLAEKSANLPVRSSSQSNVGDHKAQKSAMLEAELRDAISALRRPNRELAGKAIVEAAEKRAEGTPARRRKSKKPVRNPFPDGIQVKATPVNNRFRDVILEESKALRSFSMAQIQEDVDVIPPSSSMVPSTAPRGPFQSVTFDSPHVAATPWAKKIKGTPTRGPTSHTGYLTAPVQDDFVPGSSPLQARKSAPASQASLEIHHFPSREGRLFAGPSSPAIGGLFETPVKQRPSATDEGRAGPGAPSPIRASPVPAAGRQSIYQRLGWDDDDLDDLA